MMMNIVDAAVRDAPDFALVAHVSETEFEDAVERLTPDVVIVCAGDRTGEQEARRVLADHPRLKLMLISRDGAAARLLELRQVVVDDLSPSTVVQAIRAALQRPAH